MGACCGAIGHPEVGTTAGIILEDSLAVADGRKIGSNVTFAGVMLNVPTAVPSVRQRPFVSVLSTPAAK